MDSMDSMHSHWEVKIFTIEGTVGTTRVRDDGSAYLTFSMERVANCRRLGSSCSIDVFHSFQVRVQPCLLQTSIITLIHKRWVATVY